MKALLFCFLMYSMITCQAQRTYKAGDKAMGGMVVKLIPGMYVKYFVVSTDIGEMNWIEAKDSCEKLVLNGYDDWRLPTIEELKLIYDSVWNNSNNNWGYYFGCASFWSSTTDEYGVVYNFYFLDGRPHTYGGKSLAHHVIAVRYGRPPLQKVKHPRDTLDRRFNQFP